MEWYYIVLIILGILNLVQFFVFMYLKLQEKVVKERHDNLAEKLDRLEAKHEKLDILTRDVDAYLRYSPGENKYE
ncbi:MAG: hypothetical protein F4X56_01080 [Gammaproteobacteria bacterium]|nr:hypothetical protein [Gammaproteobacteria bacterium]